jgi:peptidoglycan/xylan/chitin deacetylase (PgdA/CDA1 family)
MLRTSGCGDGRSDRGPASPSTDTCALTAEILTQTGSTAVALTFDDGPDPHWTPLLLDILAETKAPATFFPIAARARAYPELIARMREEGHEVGLHGALHLRHGSSPDDLLECDTRLAIEWLGPEGLRLWRPPGGQCTATTRRLAAHHGLTLVRWSISCGDWLASSTTEVMLQTCIGRLTPGAVILLHDAVGPGRVPEMRSSPRLTVELVPELVHEIRKHGLQLGLFSP